MFRFPAPQQRPNPYAVFVDTFLQAKSAKEQQNQAKQRLQMQKEEADAQNEARKAATEQAKEAAELRKAEFEFQKVDADRKFKLMDLKSRTEFAESMKNFRKPASGAFQLQLPTGPTSGPMEIPPTGEGLGSIPATIPGQDGNPISLDPVFYDDVVAENAATDERRFGYDKQLRALPTPPPAAVPLQGFHMPGIPQGVDSVDPRLLDAATSRANNAAAIAASAARGAGERDSPLDWVKVTDAVGNLRGSYNKRKQQFVPIGPDDPTNMRSAAVPQSEFGKLDAGKQAFDAFIPIEESFRKFRETSLLNPVDKAMAGAQLNSEVQAMSRTIGRALGEKGVFTDADKADFATFIYPGLVLSTLRPEDAEKRLNGAKAVINRAIARQAKTFYERYGMLPEDMKQYMPVGAGKGRVTNDPGGLFPQ